MDQNIDENVYTIEVNDVYKKYRIYKDKGKELKERLLFMSRNRYTVNEVLKGVSIKVKKGEAVGLVGHNGCGKSTLLKMLSRIIYPDQGEIVTRGRISGLIELGADSAEINHKLFNLFSNLSSSLTVS